MIFAETLDLVRQGRKNQTRRLWQPHWQLTTLAYGDVRFSNKPQGLDVRDRDWPNLMSTRLTAEKGNIRQSDCPAAAFPFVPEKYAQRRASFRLSQSLVAGTGGAGSDASRSAAVGVSASEKRTKGTGNNKRNIVCVRASLFV